MIQLCSHVTCIPWAGSFYLHNQHTTGSHVIPHITNSDCENYLGESVSYGFEMRGRGRGGAPLVAWLVVLGWAVSKHWCSPPWHPPPAVSPMASSPSCCTPDNKPGTPLNYAKGSKESTALVLDLISGTIYFAHASKFQPSALHYSSIFQEQCFTVLGNYSLRACLKITILTRKRKKTMAMHYEERYG